MAQQMAAAGDARLPAARAVLHGSRAAAASRVPQCMVNILRPEMFIFFSLFFLQFANVCVRSLDLSDLMVSTKPDRRFTSENSW
jgi:hypothetical protein